MITGQKFSWSELVGIETNQAQSEAEVEAKDNTKHRGMFLQCLAQSPSFSWGLSWFYTHLIQPPTDPGEFNLANVESNIFKEEVICRNPSGK